MFIGERGWDEEEKELLNAVDCGWLRVFAAGYDGKRHIYLEVPLVYTWSFDEASTSSHPNLTTITVSAADTVLSSDVTTYSLVVAYGTCITSLIDSEY